MQEFELIAKLFRPLAEGFPGALRLEDDAALVNPPPGESLVVTTDMLVAGVHFRAADPPSAIARKVVRVNLSDLAAMGAKPLAVLLAAGFEKGAGDDWLREFAHGLAQDMKEFRIHLIGGDTVATPGPATFSLTALGTVPAGKELRRSDAKPGDLICMSGTLGEGALGLRVLDGGLPGLSPEDRAYLARRYLVPEPRVGLGPMLIGLANAGMDISDGLVADLGHICDNSDLGAEIDWARVPLSDAARRALAEDASLTSIVLGGGDDYELLFTIPEGRARDLASVSAAAGVPAAIIGRMVEGAGVVVKDRDGRRIAVEKAGYAHF